MIYPYMTLNDDTEITNTGKALLCNNNSKISSKMLKDIMRHTEANSDLIHETFHIIGECT